MLLNQTTQSGQSGGNRGRNNYTTKGRGFPQQISSGSPSDSGTRPTCQICNKYGHSAYKCWKRFDHAFQSEDFSKAFAAMRVSDQKSNPWVTDSGATSHITNSTSQLQSAQPYSGEDSVIVGNSDFLPITHIGSAVLTSNQGNLPLRDVLVCPNITKSLLSVSKLTSDYPCVIEFDSDGVIVKDKLTKQLLTKGTRHNDLYLLENPKFMACYSSRQQATSDEVWHMRLGHPNQDVLQQLLRNKAIVISKTSHSLCDACQMGKICKLPFASSDFVSSRLLERVHCDLWGPAPVVSSQGFRYYVIFIDNYSRFTWFYPLRLKSDFFSVFLTFQKMVENQCQQKIASFQCDGGGEFISNQFVSHLAECGIRQLISCPYTPQQNGIAERKHRHITELGSSMMFQGKVPQFLWVEAFYTSNFLCNLLPSSVLKDQKSPYEVLMGKAPVYTSLRVFGCACYPNLRPYASNKFDPKSLLCVFTGYNEKYKGYKCFHPPTGKIYINRHVLFDESKFLFSDIYSDKVSGTNSTLVSAWQSNFLPKSIPATPEVLDISNTAASFSDEQGEFSGAVGGGGCGCTADLDSVPIGNSLPSSPVTQQNSPQPETPISSAGSGNDAEDSELSENSENSESSVFSEATTETEAADNTNDQSHPMITRSKSGIFKPNPKYAMFTVKSNYPVPKTVKTALKDPGWTDAMGEEYDSFEETHTWDLVPPDSFITPLGCRWVFKTKLKADGTLDRLKARLVAKGYEQEEGVDYMETYSPVVRTATVRTILHVATINKWEIKQLDVKNAFLHGDLKETVYMYQPPGFENQDRPDYVCKLNKAIYGLKQAPRAWFDKFSTFLLEFGFICTYSDPSLFVFLKGRDLMFLLLYMDDMLLTGNNSELLDTLLVSLNKESA
jgi:hypothetical protein